MYHNLAILETIKKQKQKSKGFHTSLSIFLLSNLVINIHVMIFLFKHIIGYMYFPSFEKA